MASNQSPPCRRSQCFQELRTRRQFHHHGDLQSKDTIAGIVPARCALGCHSLALSRTLPISALLAHCCSMQTWELHETHHDQDETEEQNKPHMKDKDPDSP